jgi:hypothetical protein
MDSFLATVDKVYPTGADFKDAKTGKEADFISIYNNNKDLHSKDARYYGAITYEFEDSKAIDDYAYPFDKNNFTFPIKGETVVIVKIENQTYWLPFSTTPYSSFRQDYPTYRLSTPEDITPPASTSSGGDKRQTAQTGGTNNSGGKSQSKKYKVNDKIKFLKPKEGDTFLTGRVGNTIRFSEFFLTEDDKTASPSIFIRNKQNPELDSKKIGELIEEDINKDGTSIYLVSNKVKVPFKEEIKKEKVGFKGYPSSGDFKGDQLFVNSDRILLSAKAKEFIIFGKSNTGIITDGNFSVDTAKDVYMHADKNITIHSKGSNQIFLNSDSGGKIYLGKNKGEGDAGADVQKMVLGGELVKVLEDLIDAIVQQVYLTPCGPSATGPVNAPKFNSIKSKLKVILSARNFLAKN